MESLQNMIFPLLLTVLIILEILLVFLIFRDKSNTVENQIPVINNEDNGGLFILFFKQFLEADIDTLYNHLIPDNEFVTEETETILGEGKLGSKIFPIEVGSSISKTFKKQIKSPDPLFKYEYIIRKLKQKNELTIIDASVSDQNDLIQFENIINELTKFNAALPDETIKKVKAQISDGKTIDKLLKERFNKSKKLNCLILNFPFTVTKNEFGFELISEKGHLHSTTVKVDLSNTTLTPRGKEYFQSSCEQKRYFSIFGEAEICETNEDEFISINSFVVF